MQLIPVVATSTQTTTPTERSSRADLYAILLFSPSAWTPPPPLVTPSTSRLGDRQRPVFRRS